jgi:hypothetical protein
LDGKPRRRDSVEDVDRVMLKITRLYNDREFLGQLLMEYFVPRNQNTFYVIENNWNTHEAPL